MMTMMMMVMVLMRRQVKLSREQASEPTTSSETHDTRDSHEIVDDDEAKPHRRSFTESAAPPVSCLPLFLSHCCQLYLTCTKLQFILTLTAKYSD